jgi:hypothetical protein
MKLKDFTRVSPIINPVKVSADRPAIITLESKKQVLEFRW